VASHFCFFIFFFFFCLWELCTRWLLRKSACMYGTLPSFSCVLLGMFRQVVKMLVLWKICKSIWEGQQWYARQKQNKIYLYELLFLSFCYLVRSGICLLICFCFFSLNGCNLCFYAISSGAIVHSSMLCAAIIDQLDLWDHFFMWMARAILHSSMWVAAIMDPLDLSDHKWSKSTRNQRRSTRKSSQFRRDIPFHRLCPGWIHHQHWPVLNHRLAD